MLSKYFRYFTIIFPRERSWPFNWTHLKGLYFCQVKLKLAQWFGEDECDKFTDRWKDRQIYAQKEDRHQKSKVTWTFSSGELKNILIKQITWGKVCVFNTQTGGKTNGVGINFDYIQLLNMVMIIEFSLGLYTEFYPTSTVYIYGGSLSNLATFQKFQTYP